MNAPRRNALRHLDVWLGVVDAPQLNWKGRSIERLLCARSLALSRLCACLSWLCACAGSTTDSMSQLGRRIAHKVDTWLGIVPAPQLNWKGRAIERVLCARRVVVQGLIERPRRLYQGFFRRVDGWLGVVHAPELNWKGRTIERFLAAPRLRALPRRVAARASALAFVAANAIGFWLYSTLGRLRRRDTIGSVLQLSIISHKQFMVSRAMRHHGLKSDYFALNVGADEGILNLGYDYCLKTGIPAAKRRWLECYYLWTVLARYDVIHSHFKSLLSGDGWEFDYLKRLGKVVVFHYRGCDIRYRSLNMRLHPQLNCCQECEYPVGSCDTDYQRSQVALTRKYGDLFFVTTPDLMDFSPGSEHIPFISPLEVDWDGLVPVDRDRSVFRVVTSSNHHGVDGTRFIRDAVKRLKGEGRAIELVEVSHMRYLDALATYKSADVYVGKLRMGYYNNANIETMLLGVPNMSYIREDFRSIAPDCPIIVTRPETVYERLLYYLDHRDELRAIGARGPAFVRANHDPDAIALRMIERYNEVFAARRRKRGPARVEAPAPAASGGPMPVTRDITRVH